MSHFKPSAGLACALVCGIALSCGDGDKSAFFSPGVEPGGGPNLPRNNNETSLGGTAGSAGSSSGVTGGSSSGGQQGSAGEPSANGGTSSGGVTGGTSSGGKSSGGTSSGGRAAGGAPPVQGGSSGAPGEVVCTANKDCGPQKYCKKSGCEAATGK